MKLRGRLSTVLIILLALVLAIIGVLIAAYSTLPLLQESTQLYLAATYFALGCLACIFLYALVSSPFDRLLKKKRDASVQDPVRSAEAFATEEAKKWQQELEASVEARTLELEKTSARLMRTRERLFEAEKLAFLGQLGAGISHQMKNPLGIVKTAAFFITDASQDEEVVEQAQIIAKETDRMVESINSLLRFARQAAVSTQGPVDLAALVSETLKGASMSGRLQGIRLETSIGSAVPPIRADASQIQQVLLNLVINATQAMPEGGALTVSVQEDDGFVEMRITDTGIGIAPDRLDKIWEPFYSDRKDGTGIGLAICKGILDRHKARVNVVSEEGMGTTFAVRFPVFRGEDLLEA